ncbi:MAG: hypothetical protein KAY37_08740 [Phycisphaerae bacterium]|nr:hypothetical protein [Phycisphaerae bacterium]
MDFRNSTDLDSERLRRMFERHTSPYRHDRLQVRVRWSRGADFSGTCYYSEQRIFVNLGRDNAYPYLLGTHIAKSESNRTHWWRETFRVVIPDAYRLALFVYLHEFYHYLVKMAKRNPRRKEAMCDRFATRVLVDEHGCRVIDSRCRPVARQRWDFQDVHAFVAAAPKIATAIEMPVIPKDATLFDLPPSPPTREIPVTIVGAHTGPRRKARERSPDSGRASSGAG